MILVNWGYRVGMIVLMIWRGIKLGCIKLYLFNWVLFFDLLMSVLIVFNFIMILESFFCMCWYLEILIVLIRSCEIFNRNLILIICLMMIWWKVKVWNEFFVIKFLVVLILL